MTRMDTRSTVTLQTTSDTLEDDPVTTAILEAAGRPVTLAALEVQRAAAAAQAQLHRRPPVPLMPTEGVHNA